MWVENSKSVHNLKILAFCVNAYQRETLAEEGFTTQGDIMVHSVDINQPCLSFPNGLINKVAIMAGMEVIDGFYNVSTLLG